MRTIKAPAARMVAGPRPRRDQPGRCFSLRQLARVEDGKWRQGGLGSPENHPELEECLVLLEINSMEDFPRPIDRCRRPSWLRVPGPCRSGEHRRHSCMVKTAGVDRE